MLSTARWPALVRPLLRALGRVTTDQGSFLAASRSSAVSLFLIKISSDAAIEGLIQLGALRSAQ